jgi:ABC-2 type transport system permease protein
VSEVGRSLQTLWVIFKHEFSLFFISPIVYFIGAGWLFFAGLFFTFAMNDYNSGYAEPGMASVLGSLAFLLIFIAPAITMRMISEEIRTGTHELLFTAPVRDWEIVVGKWLGAWGVLTIFILLTVPYPLILVWRGTPDIGAGNRHPHLGPVPVPVGGVHDRDGSADRALAGGRLREPGERGGGLERYD